MPVHCPWRGEQGTPLRVHHPRNQPVSWGDPGEGNFFSLETSGPKCAGTGTREHANTILASTAISVVTVVGGTLKCNAAKMRRWWQGQRGSRLQKEEKGRQKSNFGPVGLTLQDLGICCLDELECKIHRVQPPTPPRIGMCTHIWIDINMDRGQGGVVSPLIGLSVIMQHQLQASLPRPLVGRPVKYSPKGEKSVARVMKCKCINRSHGRTPTFGVPGGGGKVDGTRSAV